MHVYMSVCVSACLSACMHMYICVRMYACMHAHMQYTYVLPPRRTNLCNAKCEVHACVLFMQTVCIF